MRINLFPKKKRKIIRLKNEFAKELDLPFKKLSGKSMKKQGSSIGGKMVNGMVETYKKLF